jgi:hypothetical protein
VLQPVVLRAWSKSFRVEVVVHVHLYADTVVPVLRGVLPLLLNLLLSLLLKVVILQIDVLYYYLLIFLQGCKELRISSDGLLAVYYWVACFLVVFDLT